MVKVERSPRGTNYDGPVEEHADATSIKVEDGHLHVLRRNGGTHDTVAIYAPQKWLHAVVVS
jgi:hypothetical protein